MKIDDFSNGMVLKDGIWFSKKKTEISYPDEGNDLCYQLEDDSYWFNHRNSCISSLVKKFSKNDVFFDIGGGNGYVSLGLQKDGIESVLLEPGIQGVENAKKRGLKNLICSTLEDADIKNNSVSASGAFDVIEHIKDDLGFLKIINKITKKGGYLYLTVPALKELWSDEDVFAGHYRRYSLKTLSTVLNSAGFELVFGTYIFSILVLPIFLFRSIPSFFNLRKGGKEKNFKKEHSLNDGLTGKLFKRSFRSEINRINNLNRIPLGSSCLVVARKVK